MRSFLIMTTPLRKVTEYVMSTLLTLKKSKTKNTVLTIPHKGLNTRSLNQTATTLIHSQNSTTDIKNQNFYLPPPPCIEDLHTWYGRGCGRARHLELHSHRLYGEKTRSLESRLVRKHKKDQCLQERRSAHT